MDDRRAGRDLKHGAGDGTPLGFARSPKVALINSIVAHKDAISAAVADTYKVLAEDNAFQVSLFSYRNDYPDLPSHTVSSINDLLFHPEYLGADILLWHFGVAYDLFNATLIGNGRAPRVVRFHNVTPTRFLPKRFWETINKSHRQCHLMRGVEEIWADSPANAQEACAFGVDPARIHELPLIVEGGSVTLPSDKAPAPIEILFVGRFVRAKGVLDLLAAIDDLRDIGVPFRVDLAGNVEFSDQDYVAEVRATIERKALGDMVTMHGTVDDDSLASLYARAHILAIPSYHEGFCKPVIEALRAGCIPVGYAAYNLPYVANDFGRLVPPGDIEALGAALRALIEAMPGALQSPSTANLPLDMGTVSLNALAPKIERYLTRFAAAQAGGAMRQRLAGLLNSNGFTGSIS